MRVLQLGKFYPIRGGVEKVMYDLLNGLAQHEVDCDMLCAHGEKGSREVNLSPHSRVICTRTLFKKYATMISPQMILTLRRIAPTYDIIHVHHPDPMAAMALWCSGYKGHVVLHWHSDILKQKHLLRLYAPLQQWLIRRADTIIGTTQCYIDHSPLLQPHLEKCTVLPIGIDPIAPDPIGAERLRNRYWGRKIIFSLGRLVHYKGYRYLIEAATHLPDNYVVLIGGSGNLMQELQQQIADSHLEEKVYLIGRIHDEELAAYYTACDLYCLSSRQKTEAFAIVQIEAMSCGKPVVSTKIPGSGVSWVNADGVSGLVVNIEDGAALASAIRRIMDNPELYHQLSEGAHNRYKQLFTKEKMVDRCLEIYDKLLKS